MAKPTLQDLEVLNVGIFRVDIELDAGHGHVKEDAVVDLAKGGTAMMGAHGQLGRHGSQVPRCGGGVLDLPSSALLNLGDVELEQAVEPLNEFLPAVRVLCQSVP